MIHKLKKYDKEYYIQLILILRFILLLKDNI